MQSSIRPASVFLPHAGARPACDAMWRDNDVNAHGEGTKYLRHPTAGLIGMEYSAFAVDGRPNLDLVIYHPATPEDAARVKELILSKTR